MVEDRVLPFRQTSSGWAILDVHYSAVPGYDFAAASLGLSRQAIRTELEIDFLASTGKVVYPEFSQELHVSKEPLLFDPHRTLFVGLDVPGTPAAVVLQLDAFGRCCVLANLSPPEEESLGYYEFYERLAELLQRRFCKPHGIELEHLDVEFYGDPAGRVPIPKPGQSPKEARSCWDILRDGMEMVIGIDEQGRQIVEKKPGWGWRVQAGSVGVTARLEAVRARLTTILRGGVPAFAVDPGCRTVIEALGGGYCYHQRANGVYEIDPCKDFYSHTADALAYPCSKLFARTAAGSTDEWGEATRHEVVSRTSARAIRGGGR